MAFKIVLITIIMSEIFQKYKHIFGTLNISNSVNIINTVVITLFKTKKKKIVKIWIITNMYGRNLKKMITDRILIRSKMFLSQEIVELSLDIKKLLAH